MRHRIRAAGILIEEGRLLLVREGVLSNGQEYWIPPGGGFEPTDASLTDCLRREFLEETGYAVDVGPLAYVREFAEPRASTRHFEVFFCVNRVDAQRVECELRSVRWFTRDELRGVIVLPNEVKAEFLADKTMSMPRYLGVSCES